MTNIKKDSFTHYKVTVSMKEFKEKLGIPKSLHPFTIFVTGYNGVEITCSGSVPDPEPEPVKKGVLDLPPAKKRWWQR